MADATVKHFIFSRFFPYQRKGYPYDVLDVDFLSKQLPLAKNILSSLENQTNKNFDLVFLVNEKFFDNPTYEFVFKTLCGEIALEKAFDNVTLSVKFFIEFMFYDSITFVGNANCSSLLLNKGSNFIGRISFIDQNFFARQFNFIE